MQRRLRQHLSIAIASSMQLHAQPKLTIPIRPLELACGKRLGNGRVALHGQLSRSEPGPQSCSHHLVVVRVDPACKIASRGRLSNASRSRRPSDPSEQSPRDARYKGVASAARALDARRRRRQHLKADLARRSERTARARPQDAQWSTCHNNIYHTRPHERGRGVAQRRLA
eukprot:scaffold251124_cov32-Tisochrysis_lutea.AAC.3